MKNIRISYIVKHTRISLTPVLAACYHAPEDIPWFNS
jgi:hypothetical protein